MTITQVSQKIEMKGPDQYQTLEDCLSMVDRLVKSLSPHLDLETKQEFSRLSLRLAYLCQTHPHCTEARATYLLWIRTQLTRNLNRAHAILQSAPL